MRDDPYYVDPKWERQQECDCGPDDDYARSFRGMEGRGACTAGFNLWGDGTACCRRCCSTWKATAAQVKRWERERRREVIAIAWKHWMPIVVHLRWWRKWEFTHPFRVTLEEFGWWPPPWRKKQEDEIPF